MILPHRYVKFKEGQEKELLQEYQGILHRLHLILNDMAVYCEASGQELVITDLLSSPDEDKRLGRVSKSHEEGRAADIRVRNWPDSFRKKFEETFEKRYVRWAAVGARTGKANLFEIHNSGSGLHCHVQIRPYKEN